MGYRVLGGGYWVSGIGPFHSFQHARRQMGRRILVFGKWALGSGYWVAASLSKSNTLDARMGRRIFIV